LFYIIILNHFQHSIDALVEIRPIERECNYKNPITVRLWFP
jgi:hypothetical protein